MSILVRCPECGSFRSTDLEVCNCGFDITKDRRYYFQVYIDTPRGKKQKRCRAYVLVRGGRRAAKNLREAKQAERKYLADHDRWHNRDRRISFYDFVDCYFLPDLRDKGYRDLRSVMSVLKHCTKHFWGDRLDTITTSSCNEFYKSFLRQGYAVSTAERYFAVLHRSLQFAVEEGFIKDNPAAAVQRVRVPERRFHVLELAEEQRLLNEAKRSGCKILYDFLRVSIGTAMRRGETCNLTHRNVDFNNKIITITGEQSKSRRMRMIPIREDLVGNVKAWCV